MTIQKTRGFILKRDEIRETSILLTAYTRDFGKLKLISKGVRSPEQRYISAYELFSLDDIVFYERRKKGFFLLSQCELVNFFPKIRDSLEKISYAAYFAELLNCVTMAGDKNIKLYELLQDCLNLLSGKASPKRVARVFEIRVLSALGLMPRLKDCAVCGKKTVKGQAGFSISSGGILCDACRKKTKGTKPILAGTVNFMADIESLPFDKARQIKVSKSVGKEVERLLGSFMDYHLDIRLRTREFIDKIGI